MLGENIKALRKSKGFTQEELAVRVNVVRQTVSKWDKGLSVPDAATLQKLADVLETEVSQLLGADIHSERNKNEIAEQLSRINEQLIIKNRRSRRIWKTIGIIFLIIFIRFQICYTAKAEATSFLRSSYGHPQVQTVPSSARDAPCPVVTPSQKGLGSAFSVCLLYHISRKK